MLRCINPNEAKMLDAASGVHVKFRLAGVSRLKLELLFVLDKEKLCEKYWYCINLCCIVGVNRAY